MVRQTAGRTDAFTKHHANEALNAQTWFTAIWIGLLLPLEIPLWSAFRSGGTPEEPRVWVVALIPIAMVTYLGFLALSIFATVRASRSQWYRYPLPFRFVRGSRARVSS